MAPARRRATCLVAHPIGTIRGYLRFFLEEQHDILVIGVAHAIRAIDVVRHEKPDLVIIGGAIDRSGGADTIAAIRRFAVRKQPKIIAIVEDATRAGSFRKAGADVVVGTIREKRLRMVLKRIGL